MSEAAEPAAAAATHLARRRVRQALGAARKAATLLRQAEDGFDCYGTARVVDVQQADDLREMVLLALAERGEVEVVLLVGAPSPTAPNGARSSHNGTTESAVPAALER